MIILQTRNDKQACVGVYVGVCDLWSDNKGTDKHRSKPVLLAKRQCYTESCTRLQFRTRRFETLINWMEEFCANDVVAVQDLAAEDSKSNKLMPGDFFSLLLLLLVMCSGCDSAVR